MKLIDSEILKADTLCQAYPESSNSLIFSVELAHHITPLEMLLQRKFSNVNDRGYLPQNTIDIFVLLHDTFSPEGRRLLHIETLEPFLLQVL